ncbi:hypothetical protein [Halomonas sp. H10-9-1]|uniref:hypothetical protein n=1 Tax=Halomonas sp. H10-9-1 TaxID=2950871 RepID=UPI0032DFD1F7
MNASHLSHYRANHVEPSLITITCTRDGLPLEQVYDVEDCHSCCQDDPTPQDLGAEGVDDTSALPSDAFSDGHAEDRLAAVLSHSGHGPANVAIKTVFKAAITQMMALSHRGEQTKVPLLGPQSYPVAALCRELVEPGKDTPFPLPITGLESVNGLDSFQDLHAAIRNEDLVVVTTPRQGSIAKELASIRAKFGCYAPIMVVKHHGSKVEPALQYAPDGAKGINVVYPDLPRLMEEARDLASMLRPELMSLMRRVSERWTTERVSTRNADTHDGIRWLWLVADELGLSSSQMDDLSWTMHINSRYCRQSRDLLVRI